MRTVSINTIIGSGHIKYRMRKPKSPYKAGELVRFKLYNKTIDTIVIDNTEGDVHPCRCCVFSDWSRCPAYSSGRHRVCDNTLGWTTLVSFRPIEEIMEDL